MTRILDLAMGVIPEKKRLGILMALLRYSSAALLDTVLANKEGFDFEEQLGKYFTALEGITQRLAELSASFGDSTVSTAILKHLLTLDNQFYRVISAYAVQYDNGLHPKHRLTGYHDFFCKNVGGTESVLDIGCGNGFLTHDIAKSTRGKVVAIDMNVSNIEFARNHYHADNIEFVLGDVTTEIADSHFDTVVMSNVLEHLSNRAEFLGDIRERLLPSKFLLRVPMYEREWMVPLKEELAINHLLDDTHEIEYTLEAFFKELREGGLRPEKWEIKWGEIWCVAVPL